MLQAERSGFSQVLRQPEQAAITRGLETRSLFHFLSSATAFILLLPTTSFLPVHRNHIFNAYVRVCVWGGSLYIRPACTTRRPPRALILVYEITIESKMWIWFWKRNHAKSKYAAQKIYKNESSSTQPALRGVALIALAFCFFTKKHYRTSGLNICCPLLVKTEAAATTQHCLNMSIIPEHIRSPKA